MHPVRFKDLDVVVQAAPGACLLDVCLDHDIEMEAACGGFAACNTCRVRVEQDGLSAKEDIEEPFLDRPDQRLGCQAFIQGPCVLSLDPGET
jgi:ferredoxin, 2Fe-2S